VSAPIPYHLPGRDTAGAPAAVTSDLIGTVVADLRGGAHELGSISVGERVAAIDRAAGAWLGAKSRWRRAALDTVPRRTGYPPRVVGDAIERLWTALRRDDLEAALIAEPPPAETAEVVFHALAGNVPGVGVFGMVAALLAGAASLVKTAKREPVLPALAAQSIAEADARLGRALAVVHWSRDDAAVTARALADTDLTVAYGRAESLAALAATGGRRLVAHGPRLSAAIVTREAADAATAVLAAREAALFDQQGCLSPQLVFLEDEGREAATRFARTLAGELARLEALLPRAALAAAEAAAVWSFVERQRWRAQEGADVAVHAAPDARFGVVVDRSGDPPASPLWRHVVVVPVVRLADAGATLARLAPGAVEAIGWAGTARRAAEVADAGARCGAQRLCPLGRMHAPPFAWRQSGHQRFGVFARA
jgi:hypothetical protein